MWGKLRGLTDYKLYYLFIINLLLYSYGGRGGIRTHERLASLPVFKTGAFNRSATLPYTSVHHGVGRLRA